MTTDERQAMFERIAGATCPFSGLSTDELEDQIRRVYLLCADAKRKGKLRDRYSVVTGSVVLNGSRL